MRQISTFRYEVEAGEIVTIVATPHGCNGSVRASEGGHTVAMTRDSPPTFTLTVTKPLGQKHRLFIRADFLPDDEPDASMMLSLSGSGGGGAFSGDSLDRPDSTDPDQWDETGFQFKVVA